jgi:hypothetical protein
MSAEQQAAIDRLGIGGVRKLRAAQAAAAVPAQPEPSKALSSAQPAVSVATADRPQIRVPPSERSMSSDQYYQQQRAARGEPASHGDDASDGMRRMNFGASQKAGASPLSSPGGGGGAQGTLASSVTRMFTQLQSFLQNEFLSPEMHEDDEEPAPGAHGYSPLGGARRH